MSEPALHQDSFKPEPGKRIAVRRVSGGSTFHVIWRGANFLLAATALVWLIRLVISGEAVQGPWAVQALLAVVSIVAGGWGAVHYHRQWAVPTRGLAELLPRVQRSEAPIESLFDMEGGPRVLVPAISELLREIRSQRAAVAELEMEMRQKVANRTDALERTIGSLRQQATRDVLTGLFNRRFLDQYLAQCVQRHVKERKDLCLLMIDVDNFKVLNDTLGHAAGDDLLRAIGQLVRSAIRGEDVGFRCGGDEFVILMPDSSEQAGQVLAERLVSLVDALAKTLKVPKPPRLSIGLTTLRKSDYRTPESLLDDADRALYEVKRSRRTAREVAQEAARESAREGLNAAAAGVQSPPPSRKAG